MQMTLSGEVVLCTLSSKFASISEIVLSHRLEGIQDLSPCMDLLTKKGKSWIHVAYVIVLFFGVHTHLIHFFICQFLL